MKYLYLCFVNLALLFPVFAHAQNLYFVSPTKGEVSQDIKNISVDIITKAINSDSNSKATDDISKANFTLNMSISKLTYNYIVSLKKCSTNSQANECQIENELKVTNLDELDVALKRLTNSTIRNEKVSESKQIGQVTDNEVNLVSKSQLAKRSFKLGLGTNIFTGIEKDKTSTSNFGYAFLFGWSYLVSEQFGINIDSLFAWTTAGSGSLFTIGLGPQYYFSANDISPYVKGNLSFYGVNNKNDNTAGGLALTGGAGVSFFRTSDVNMFVETGYTITTKSIDGSLPGAFYLMIGVSR